MASEELAIIIRAKDYATSVFHKVTSRIKEMVSSAISVRSAFAVAGAAFIGMRVMDHAAALDSVSMSFDRLSQKIGGTEHILASLRRGTRDTVSDFKLMEAANRAILFGVGASAEQFENFSMVARRLGRAVGRDTTDALNDLLIGIGRQSRLFLDNIGIIVKVAEANRAMAASLGKNVDELTDTEKRQAFLNASMKAGAVAVARLGEDTYTLADAWEHFKAVLANTTNDLIRSATPAIKTMFGNISDWITNNRPRIFSFFKNLANILAEFASACAESAISLDKTVGVLGSLGTRADIVVTATSGWLARQLGPKAVHELGIQMIEDARAKSEALFSNHEMRAYSLRAAAMAAKEAADAAGIAMDNLIDLDKSRKFQADLRVLEKAIADFQKVIHPKMEIEEVPLMDSREMVQLRMDLVEEIKSEKELRLEMEKLGDREGRRMQKLIADWEEKRDAMHGVRLAFQELKLQSQEWGTAMHDGIIQMTEAMGSGIVDGLMAMGENFREAGKAARAMAVSIVKDLARIALQLTIIKMLQAGLGGLFGGVSNEYSSPSSPLFVSAADRSLVTTTQAHGFAYGGTQMRSGLAVVGEAGPELVELPGGSRVHPNGSLGSTINVNITNVNPVFTTKEQERRFTRMEQDQIRAIVAQANNSSVNFREAMAAA